MGWREFSDDTQRLAFWASVVATVIAAIGAGVYWNWWSYAWHVPPPIRALIVLAAMALVFIVCWIVLLVGNRYLGWPPFAPRVLKRAKVDVVAEAHRKQIRAQAGGYLREMYDQIARHAIGDAFKQCGTVIAALREQPSDPLRYLVADLLAETWQETQSGIRPLLDVQSCTSEAELKRCAEAWGELFMRYQALVRYTFDAYNALGIRPWVAAERNYREWREYDDKFIKAIQKAEYIEGCEPLVYFIKKAGVGAACRPKLES